VHYLPLHRLAGQPRAGEGQARINFCGPAAAITFASSPIEARTSSSHFMTGVETGTVVQDGTRLQKLSRIAFWKVTGGSAWRAVAGGHPIEHFEPHELSLDTSPSVISINIVSSGKDAHTATPIRSYERPRAGLRAKRPFPRGDPHTHATPKAQWVDDKADSYIASRLCPCIRRSTACPDWKLISIILPLRARFF
jgi:hypothetical protein